MFSPAPISPPPDIALYWTDEQLFMSLDKLEHGCPLPSNVWADINPYQYRPSNLPDGIWYFVRSEEKKDSELGFWKARGDTCVIFTDSVITGWRTTLDFYEGRAPHERRTDWVMQEYKITQKGLRDSSKQKDFKSLCRVFCTDERSSNQEMNSKQIGAASDGRNHSHAMARAILKADSSTGQNSKSEWQVKNRDYETEFEPGCFSKGDFLELDDLAEPESPSSSSNNSSFRSLTSDACFDALALLQDIEDDKNQDLQGKISTPKYSVSTTVKPDEVVMRPDNLGSLVNDNGSTLPLERTQSGSLSEKKFMNQKLLESAVKTKKANHMKGTTNFFNVKASSSRNKPTSNGENKSTVGIMKKLKKKYLCFKSF